MSPNDKRHTKKEVIENAWDELNSESAGARELEHIQRALLQSLGPGAVESPAKIARTLADLGVTLCHPEVLNADLAWRESQVETLFESGDIAFGTISSAVSSMTLIEKRRVGFIELGNETGVESLKEYVREIRAELSRQDADLAVEIVDWLRIWLQNPEVFTEWLVLRQRSVEFMKKFP